MNLYRADLHIHTLLSPCGDLDMSPINILNKARERDLQIIGITDHNTTKHCQLTRKLAEKSGIFVVMGVEITTKEEAHCLAFFETDEKLSEFQEFLDLHITKFKNDPLQFGYQPVIDEAEGIIEEVDYLLISALDQGIDEIEQKVHSLDGLFIPAHIDRNRFSVLSQLGFIPKDLKVDAFEVTPFFEKEKFRQYMKWHAGKALLHNSDAHFIEQVGQSVTILEMEGRSFSEIKLALAGLDGRQVVN
jgi:3',5'-nucleoside bisphosphate phosphatase